MAHTEQHLTFKPRSAFSHSPRRASEAQSATGNSTFHKYYIGSRPSDHYFRSVCLFVCLFVCAEFFSAVFDPISIKLGHMLYVWV